MNEKRVTPVEAASSEAASPADRWALPRRLAAVVVRVPGIAPAQAAVRQRRRLRGKRPKARTGASADVNTQLTSHRDVFANSPTCTFSTTASTIDD
jgi:hypothetical protein